MYLKKYNSCSVCGMGRVFMSYRKMSTKSKTISIPHVDREILDGIERGEITPKSHAGKLKIGTSVMPPELVETIKKVISEGTVMKNLKADSELLCSNLITRQLPATKRDLEIKLKSSIADRIRVKREKSNDDTEDIDLKLNRKQIEHNLNQRIKAWFPVEYNTYVGKQYLIGRMAAEYAALNKIFAEINHTCPSFKPHSLFDFGSGVGTVTWVARQYWQQWLQEYFCVDSSQDMNDIAKLLLKGGDEKANYPFPGLYFRQFLPATVSSKYSLVVSSYSLFELPSVETRIQTLSKLWNKTEDFLIIVEYGTKHGFQLVNEARDFILQSESENEKSTGVHIHSPCPHEFDCPLSLTTEKPCRFYVPYLLPPFGGNSYYKSELFSYVVLRKGKRPSSDKQWPRVLKTPVRHKNRAHCKLCSKDGKIHDLLFSKSRYGLTTYHCGRSVKWGDRLPVEITECEKD